VFDNVVRIRINIYPSNNAQSARLESLSFLAEVVGRALQTDVGRTIRRSLEQALRQ
jgi:hypothetical protein